MRSGVVPFVQEKGEDGAPKGLLNLSSNDYLGLAKHPALKTAAAEAAERYGDGASCLVIAHAPWMEALEEKLVDWLGKDAALLFSSGYAAGVGH